MRVSFVGTALIAACCTVASAMPPSAPIPPSADRPVKPVILDPGHGGWDNGAISKSLGIKEKDLALAVSLKLRERLKDAMPVMLTRDDDYYVTLDQRVIDAVDWSGALFVSIHLNQTRGKKYKGAIVYSYGRDYPRHRHRRRHPKVPPMPAPPRVESSDSAELADEFTDALRDDGFRVREDRSDFYVLKDPAQPSVLIELGYLSNPEDAAHLADPAYQDKMASTLARAIQNYAAKRSLRGATAATSAPSSPNPPHF